VRKRLLAAAVVILFVLAFWQGTEKAAAARKERARAAQDASAVKAEALRLPEEKELLAQAQKKWETEKKRLWRDAAAGATAKDLEEAAKSYGAQVVFFNLGNPVERVYKNHLRAVTVSAKVYGLFPAVLGALAEMERLANPGELNSVKIKAGKNGDVTAEAQVTFYSLTPPEYREELPGEGTRADPFLPLAEPKAEGEKESGAL